MSPNRHAKRGDQVRLPRGHCHLGNIFGKASAAASFGRIASRMTSKAESGRPVGRGLSISPDISSMQHLAGCLERRQVIVGDRAIITIGLEVLGLGETEREQIHLG